MAQSYLDRYGPWALVTGASSGIGEEFARQLAAKGLSLVLLARREERLKKLADELRSKHGVQTRVVAIDLTQPDCIKDIQAQTDGLTIGLLVNNAGVANPGRFLQKPLEDFEQLIALNVNACVQLTHYFGRRMIEHSRGGMIFVSSVMGYNAGPYYACYSASKGFELLFGESLSYELKEHHIDSLVLTAGITQSELIDKMQQQGVDIRNTPFPILKTGYVVRSAINALGKRTTIIPGLFYKITTFINIRFIPRWFNIWAAGKSIERALIKKH